MVRKVFPVLLWRIHQGGQNSGCEVCSWNQQLGRNLGRLDYAIEMVEQCVVAWHDIFVSKPSGQNPIEVVSGIALKR
jgi:hypothetical protein